jgi:ABC-2 type transport system ATP-binding protein
VNVVDFSIETTDLVKTYPQPRNFFEFFGGVQKTPVTALDGVDLKIKKGEFFGVLGPNGAGKTTLTKILCTLVLPSQGAVRVNGHDVMKNGGDVRTSIGLVSSDERSFYWKISGRDNLVFFAVLNNYSWGRAKKRAAQVLEIVGLEGAADRRFETYSSGMKQKMALAKGLLNDPETLFLDEPTRSLDPNAAKEIRLFISDLSKEGKTIFLTTHNLAEAEKLCKRVAVLHRGRVQGVGSKKDLGRMLSRGERLTLVVSGLEKSGISRLKTLSVVNSLRIGGLGSGRARIIMELSEGSVSTVLSEALKLDLLIHSARTEEASLEQIFEKLTAEES